MVEGINVAIRFVQAKRRKKEREMANAKRKKEVDALSEFTGFPTGPFKDCLISAIIDEEPAKALGRAVVCGEQLG
eukprot:8736233-Alexandrium_andersonii.AAC.1